MKPPRMRIGTLMLLVAIAGLAIALVVQRGDAARRQAIAQAEIAELQAARRADTLKALEAEVQAARNSDKADQLALELRNAKAELQKLKDQKDKEPGTSVEGR